MNAMLDSRKQKILSAVIQDFTFTAEPVGSKRLVEKYDLEISPATVRNELSALEEMGYLSHPHTSAGRVPTDEGYRFYVDVLLNTQDLAVSELVEIGRVYDELTHEVGRMMKESSQLLARLTSSVAVVYAPDIRKERVKHIDLVWIGANAIMIIVIMSNGSISKQMIETAGEVSEEALGRLEARLDKSLARVAVGQVGEASIDTEGLSEPESAFLEMLMRVIEDGMEIGLADRVYSDGAASLFDHPEFTDLDQARRIIALIEADYSLLGWLREASQRTELTVQIGAENELALDGCSLIASGYGIDGESAGAVGVLGPTRMDYGRTIAAVRYVAQQLGDVVIRMHNDRLGEGGQEVDN